MQILECLAFHLVRAVEGMDSLLGLGPVRSKMWAFRAKSTVSVSDTAEIDRLKER